MVLFWSEDLRYQLYTCDDIYELKRASKQLWLSFAKTEGEGIVGSKLAV